MSMSSQLTSSSYLTLSYQHERKRSHQHDKEYHDNKTRSLGEESINSPSRLNRKQK